MHQANEIEFYQQLERQIDLYIDIQISGSGLGEDVQNYVEDLGFRVLYANQNFLAVAYNNRYAYKHALVFAMLYTADPKNSFQAFDDLMYLDCIKQEALGVKALLASELGIEFAKCSGGVPHEPMEHELGTDEASEHKVRDWEQDIIVGIHAKS